MSKDGQTVSAMENQIPVSENDHESRDTSFGKCRPLSKFIHDENEKDDLSIISFDSPVGQERKVQGPHFLPKPLKKLKSLSLGRKKENSSEKNNESAPIRINYPLFKAEIGSEVSNVTSKRDIPESELNNSINEKEKFNLNACENAESVSIADIPVKTNNIISEREQTSSVSEVVTNSTGEAFSLPVSVSITESDVKVKSIPNDPECVTEKGNVSDFAMTFAEKKIISKETDFCVSTASDEENDVATISDLRDLSKDDNTSQVEIKVDSNRDVSDNIIAPDNDVLPDNIATSKNSVLIESIESSGSEPVEVSMCSDDISKRNNTPISDSVSVANETSGIEISLTKEVLETLEIKNNENVTTDEIEKSSLGREETLINEENTETVNTVEIPSQNTKVQTFSIQPATFEKELSSENLLIAEKIVESRFVETLHSMENSCSKMDQQLSDTKFANQLSENYSEENILKLPKQPELKSQADSGDFFEELLEKNNFDSVMIGRKNKDEKTVCAEKVEVPEVEKESGSISAVEKLPVNKNIVIDENVSDENSAVTAKNSDTKITAAKISDTKIINVSDFDEVDKRLVEIDLKLAELKPHSARREAEQDSGEILDIPTELVSLVANQDFGEISVTETPNSPKKSSALKTFDSETNPAYIAEQQVIIPFSLLNNEGENRKIFNGHLPLGERESSDQEKDGQFIIFNRFLLLSRGMARKKEQASYLIQSMTEESLLPCSNGSSSEIKTSDSEISCNVNQETKLDNQENMAIFSQKTGSSEDRPKMEIIEEGFERQSQKSNEVKEKKNEDQPQENRFIRLLMRLTGRQKNHLADFLESMEDKTT